MRFKRRNRNATAPQAAGASQRERLRVDLAGRIRADVPDAVLDELLEELARGGPDSYEALLDGAAAAHRAAGGFGGELQRAQHDLQKLENLMGGFAVELSKLDEVLEVLAAYVRRMRTNSSVSDEDEDHTLH